MIFWTYNFCFLILSLFVIGILTHLLAKFTHLLHSLLSSIILFVGFISALLLFYSFSEKVPQRLEYELVEKMGYAEYQVHILPKVTPWSKETKLCFSNKDTDAKVEILINSQLDTNEIYEKIKDIQPHLAEILKYP